VKRCHDYSSWNSCSSFKWNMWGLFQLPQFILKKENYIPNIWNRWVSRSWRLKHGLKFWPKADYLPFHLCLWEPDWDCGKVAVPVYRAKKSWPLTYFLACIKCTLRQCGKCLMDKFRWSDHKDCLADGQILESSS